MQLKPLDITSIELTGQHLIEASAGTGKTFNITRLYLRLLIEKSLTVEQILVMTFTEDATAELKGRIEQTLSDALNHWSELVSKDAFFQYLNKQFDSNEIQQKLHQALLCLDDAAIFTIHGFCARILKQYAFETGNDFNAQIETDAKRLRLQAIRDHYLQLAADDAERYQQLTKGYPTPEHFLAAFAALLEKPQLTLEFQHADQIKQNYFNLVRQVLTVLNDNQRQIFEWLVNNRKDEQQRADEFTELITWLTQQAATDEPLLSPMPRKFFNGSRFKKAFKVALQNLLTPYYQLLELAKITDDGLAVAKKITKAKSYQAVAQSIVDINHNIEQLKQQENCLTFDDLIEKLANLLIQPNPQNALAAQLFQQFPAALIDEFQDTDQRQIAIINAIYQNHKNKSLFFIGDPKQAIYGFRGGDIFAYLQAREQCQFHWLMDTNWRSTANMVKAYNRLFYGKPLNEPSKGVFGYNIDYVPVKAKPNAQPDNQAAIELINIQGQESLNINEVRDNIANWCAAKIAALLAEQRCLSSDIAILVRKGNEAEHIKTALDKLNIPSVYLSVRDNIFQSVEALSLYATLKGICYLEDNRLYTSALASQLINMPAEQILQLEQNPIDFEQQKQQFVYLREIWRKQSFITMALTLLHQQHNLRQNGLDRALTNYLQLFEILQKLSQQYKQPEALLYWFEQQLNPELAQNEHEIRLESDDNLIKIVTQHGSKGLEYPIVFIPFASLYDDPTKIGNKPIELLNYHDEQGKLHYFLGQDEQVTQLAKQEGLAELVRLFYVAVTRAEQKCYIVAVEQKKQQHQASPLGIVLSYFDEQDSSWTFEQKLSTLVTELPQEIHFQVVSELNNATNKPLTSKPLQQTLQAAKFNGVIERDWWLSSFSALTRHVHQFGLAQPNRDIDETLDIDLPEHQAQQIRFTLAKGATTGNFLHEVLQHADFQNIADTLNKVSHKFAMLVEDQQLKDIQNWLTQVLATKLAPIECSLNQLSFSQTLREKAFYFPMNGQNATQLAKWLSEYRKQIREKLSITIDIDLDNAPILMLNQKLKGMMHGFIDLIFEYQNQYFVCDYKSSYLGDEFNHYSIENMQRHIEQNFYDLQYLLYALALHRYLKIRVENYQVERHLGGVFYCYLRGMSPEQPAAGVYFQPIAESTLTELESILGIAEVSYG